MASPSLISQDGLAALLQALADQGYALIGPKVREGAIGFEALSGIDELPRGLHEVQRAGSYRLEATGGPELFGYASTASSLKRHFHPPSAPLFTLRRSATGPELGCVPRAPKLAVIGARGCDLAGLRSLDGVLGQGSASDPAYRARRANTWIVAVQCGRAGGTCFCTTMGTGPAVTADFDLALTELPKANGTETEFLIESGSERGQALLEGLPHLPASEADVARARARVAATAASLPVRFDPARVRTRLQEVPEHARWQAVADRCLSCGNCTMVCPTCFCTHVEEAEDWQTPAEEHARQRTWDSCFTTDFSYVHGGSVRASTRAKYRQWLTHKFSTWFDQFGGSGCVGCGRCMTWCPVAIDVTSEIVALADPEPPFQESR